MQGRRRNREGAQTRCDPLKSAPPTHAHIHTPYWQLGPRGWWQGTREVSGCETTTSPAPSFL